MRSRYAAFVLGDAAYLWRTLHPDHDDRAAGEAKYRGSLEKNFALLRYRSLAILDRRPPDRDRVALVLFAVSIAAKKGGDRSFVELSRFANDGTGWRYLVGTSKPAAELEVDPRSLRIGDGRSPD
jgi:SEC-C motif-containing protein